MNTPKNEKNLCIRLAGVSNKDRNILAKLINRAGYPECDMLTDYYDDRSSYVYYNNRNRMTTFSQTEKTFIDFANSNSHTFVKFEDIVKRLEKEISEIESKRRVFDIQLGDRVIARDNASCVWQLAEYGGIVLNDSFDAFARWWSFMAPFKGNEHLLGTTEFPEYWWTAVGGIPVCYSRDIL